MKRKHLANIYLLWMLIFVLIPIILILYSGFTVENKGFSLDNFSKFMSSMYLVVLWRSIKLAISATVICFILGYPVAYIISREGGSKKNFLLLLLVIPMWMNFLLRTYAWISMLGKNGFINKFLELIGVGQINFMYTNGAVLLGMVYNFLPFMILPIYSVLDKIDYTLIEAARDLGATEKQVFTKVVFPLSMPGIMSGVSMVFIPAVSTFVISSLLGGDKYHLIGNIIERQFRWVNDWNFGSAIAIILMLFILLLVWMTKKISNSNMENEKGGGLF